MSNPTGMPGAGLPRWDGTSRTEEHGYRPDIDGLRAVAVISVIAYHAWPGVAPGGFTGVDVFFVISGFLITGIILGGMEDGSFTFGGFYARRVRRIFPALILTLLATLGLGWLLILPSDYEILGKHTLAGAGFVANIAFWREAGYFDSASELKPLLHLWSLGVEEQYYIAWPLILFAGKEDGPEQGMADHQPAGGLFRLEYSLE